MIAVLSACGGGGQARSDIPRHKTGRNCTPFVLEAGDQERTLPGVCPDSGGDRAGWYDEDTDGRVLPRLATGTQDSAVPSRGAGGRVEDGGGHGNGGARRRQARGAGDRQQQGAGASGRSRSLGFANEGSLEGGLRLHADNHIEHVASEVHGRRGGNVYGTEELVALVRDASRQLRARLRGVKLRVGELSSPRGGRLPGHGSHQNGRDVDIAFFYRTAQRRRVYMDRFVPVDSGGWSGRTAQGRLQFDAQANWILLETLLLSPHAQVQYVFVADPLRTLLLEEARSQAVPSGTAPLGCHGHAAA